jgi:aspartate ammonia-lyase
VLVLALSSSCTRQQATDEAIGSARAAQPAATVQRAAIVGPTRTERDLLGEKQIPVDAYYGVQTARALENFRISGVAINHYPGFRRGLGDREAGGGARQHGRGAMKPEKLAAIEKAAAAVMNGKYHEQFIVDWYQGGAGTSTNMNANEVLANVALELTGRPQG